MQYVAREAGWAAGPPPFTLRVTASAVHIESVRCSYVGGYKGGMVLGTAQGSAQTPPSRCTAAAAVQRAKAMQLPQLPLGPTGELVDEAEEVGELVVARQSEDQL